jgi:hypothetical protein
MKDLELLMAACPPPDRVRSSGPGEKLVGTDRIPLDHRRLIGAYGVGCFDDFLWIYEEGAVNPFLDINLRTESARSGLSAPARGDFGDFLSSLSVTVDDLIQWGGTDNGDMLLWVPVGATWPVLAVGHRPLQYLMLPISSTRFIHDLLTRKLVTSIFPPDFPSDEVSFIDENRKN